MTRFGTVFLVIAAIILFGVLTKLCVSGRDAESAPRVSAEMECLLYEPCDVTTR